tara:strand:- start:351 stop:509 length:159 start_codon:yes stop_codon:yes gene_type:complete
MTITTDTLISIKSEIERLTKIDKQITDAIITIQFKENVIDKNRNFLYIDLKN